MSALEIIASVRNSGAQIRLNRCTGDLILVGRVPAGIVDAVNERRDDILAILSEHTISRMVAATDVVRAAEEIAAPLSGMARVS